MKRATLLAIVLSGCWSWPTIDPDASTPNDAACVPGRYSTLVRDQDDARIYLRLGETTLAQPGPVNARDDASGSTMVTMYVNTDDFMTGLPGAIAGDTDTAMRLVSPATVRIGGATAALDIGADSHAQFAIETWVKLPMGGPTGSITWPLFYLETMASCDMQDAGTGMSLRCGFRFGLTEGPRLRFWTTENGGTGEASSDFPAQPGWHHVVVTRCANDQVRIYVDGASSTAVRVTMSVGGGFMALGNIGGLPTTDFELDEIALYDRCLPAERVLAHFRAGRGCM